MESKTKTTKSDKVASAKTKTTPDIAKPVAAVKPFGKDEIRSRGAFRAGPTLDKVEAELLKENPDYYIFAYDTAFPRSIKGVMYADPRTISKAQFDQKTSALYAEIVAESRSY